MELVRFQYSLKQLTGQTKLPVNAGTEKVTSGPETCFLRRRRREKVTLDEDNETDAHEIEANSEIRIRVTKANKVTSL